MRHFPYEVIFDAEINHKRTFRFLYDSFFLELEITNMGKERNFVFMYDKILKTAAQ
jgi:hypothetical protein